MAVGGAVFGFAPLLGRVGAVDFCGFAHAGLVERGQHDDAPGGGEAVGDALFAAVQGEP